MSGDSQNDDMARDHTRILAGSFPTPLDAHLAQAALEAEGVRSFIEGEYAVGNAAILSGAMGGVRLMVEEADREAAIRAMTEYRRAELAAGEARARTCPVCETPTGVDVKRPFWVCLLIALTLGVFCLLCRWDLYRCETCEHRWR
jgi:hypothetical protein